MTLRDVLGVYSGDTVNIIEKRNGKADLVLFGGTYYRKEIENTLSESVLNSTVCEIGIEDENILNVYIRKDNSND